MDPASDQNCLILNLCDPQILGELIPTGISEFQTQCTPRKSVALIPTWTPWIRHNELPESRMQLVG